MKRFLISPYTVMAVVLMMYITKVAAKLSIGNYVNSPMITGDGWHNVADIFEALVVIGVLVVSRLPKSEDHQFGRMGIESLFSVLVGGGLCIMAVHIAMKSIFGLLGTTGDPIQIGPEFMPWVMGVTAGSAVLSLLVSWYQIKIGKRSGHEALVADGQETKSDGRIELVTFIGVLGQYGFGAPWIEYPFAILVAILMVRTGKEIFMRGMGVILQKSIGAEHHEQIVKIAEEMPGVEGVAEIKTFMAGPKVILILKVLTLQDSTTHPLLKKAMAMHITEYLRGQEFTQGDYFIRFDRPDPERHRRAYPIIVGEDGSRTLADHFHKATHVVICDIEHDQIVRSYRPVPWDWESGSESFLHKKRVTEIVGYTDAMIDHPALSLDFLEGPSANLEVYGL